ncbi:winged helix-turn-helix transcriptional regulator [Lentzea sp. NPDC058450]|uniref:winged helix-turn-helix transcriptional regulator n=1 Tax=Lentzea sp. NPDC058450 TaxID=3346505 RepID=UPI00364AC79A
MPLRSDWSGDGCPIARGLDVLGDPWVLLILREAVAGAERYDEFKVRLEAADNIVSSRLRAMTEAGLLRKEPYTEGARPRHRYLLTRSGADTLPILHALARWAEQHTPSDAPRLRLGVLCRGCGARTSLSDSCDQCGVELSAENVTWIRPGSWEGLRVDLTGAR